MLMNYFIEKGGKEMKEKKITGDRNILHQSYCDMVEDIGEDY